MSRGFFAAVVNTWLQNGVACLGTILVGQDLVVGKDVHAVILAQGHEAAQLKRWFGTLRAKLSRLVRRACSFSKHAENYLDAVHPFVITYNLAVQRKATVR